MLYRIEKEHDRIVVLKTIEELPLDKKYEVRIIDLKETRGLLQNSLYWVWMTEYGKEYGLSKRESDEYFKEKFLIHIYERDKIEYQETLNTIRKVWKEGLKKEAEELRRKYIALTSTRDANTKQMAEYLTDIDIDCSKHGLILPRKNEDADLLKI